jgi:hypothetical protein
MQKDLRKLKQQLAYKGVEIEYVFLPHVSAKNALLHLDGVVWVKSGSVSLFEIQVMWSNIHGATEVVFGLVESPEKVMRYIILHMFKDYDKVIGFKGRMLISKGWMPKGWLAFDKLLTRRALDTLFRFGPIVWDVKRETFNGWLKGEAILFRYDGIWQKFKREND